MRKSDTRALALLFAGSLAFAPLAVQAQSAPSPGACPANDSALPPQWAGWTSPAPLTGGASISAEGILQPGRAYTAALVPSPGITYAAPLGKPTDPATFGGLFLLAVDKAGTYAIALDQGAWIDVVSDGKVLSSSTHGHGPQCSTIHKIVQFDLQPGHYVVQISAAPKTPLLIEVTAPASVTPAS